MPAILAEGRSADDDPAVDHAHVGIFGYAAQVLLVHHHDPAVVQSLHGRLTYVVRADTADEEAMRELSVHEADHVVVAIGGDLAGSVLTTSLMLRFGVTHLLPLDGEQRTMIAEGVPLARDPRCPADVWKIATPSAGAPS